MEAVLMEKKNVYSRMDKGILNTLKDILSPYEKSTYKVAVHEFNALRFAWYQDGKFIFPDDESVAIEDFSLQYVLQLRFFNQDAEIWIQRRGDTFTYRVIVDNDGGEEMSVVDSDSPLIGKVTGAKSPSFLNVDDNERKLHRVIPASEPADDSYPFVLTTRSYIVYDDETGQAGYGYSRYVDLTWEGGK